MQVQANKPKLHGSPPIQELLYASAALLHTGTDYDTIQLCQSNEAVMFICQWENGPHLSSDLLPTLLL